MSTIPEEHNTHEQSYITTMLCIPLAIALSIPIGLSNMSGISHCMFGHKITLLQLSRKDAPHCYCCYELT